VENGEKWNKNRKRNYCGLGKPTVRRKRCLCKNRWIGWLWDRGMKEGDGGAIGLIGIIGIGLIIRIYKESRRFFTIEWQIYH